MKALVLAGGGVAGIAWELGVLRGIAEADPALAERLLRADLVVGTSAGASVAAQITSGVPLETLYEAQLATATAEIEVEVDVPALLAELTRAQEEAASAEDAGRRIGAVALSTPTVDPAVRLAAIDARLPVKTWPAQRVLLTAVDARSGALVTFSRDSGVSLLDAAAASAAVPGVWPPVVIDGTPYIDGAVHPGNGAQLATGAEAVLLIRPAQSAAGASPFTREEKEALDGARVAVIEADDASLAAFGANALSPSTRAASAQAGHAIGQREAERIAEAWG